MKGSAYISPQPITDAYLCAWLGNALPGDVLVYHRGFLAVDCDPIATRIGKSERKALELTARRARTALDMKLAHLVQRRNGIGDYSYILVVRAKPTNSQTVLRRRSQGMVVDA